MIYKQKSLQLISSRLNLIINTKLGNLLNRRNKTLLNTVKYVVFYSNGYIKINIRLLRFLLNLNEQIRQKKKYDCAYETPLRFKIYNFMFNTVSGAHFSELFVKKI